MEYLFYCRDRPGTGALREELTEAHWSFMDAYADVMIARGPTLTPDRQSATGSLHLVDLPDAEAARIFAFEEPNYRAGVYDEVLIRRCRNELGRTMWEFEGDLARNQRFLVLGHAVSDGLPDAPAWREETHRYLQELADRRRLIAGGPLLSADGAGWEGTALLVEVPDRAAVEELVADDPASRKGRYATVEIHEWQFGGRPEHVRDLG